MLRTIKLYDCYINHFHYVIFVYIIDDCYTYILNIYIAVISFGWWFGT